MKILIRYFFLLLYFAGLTALILACLAEYISPADFCPIAFFGLLYPYILAYNIIFGLFWLIGKKWKLFILCLASIIVGWPNIQRLVQIDFRKPEINSSGTFKIITFNVRNFDQYNWTNNTDTRNKIFRFFSEQAPDILCLQEYYRDDVGYLVSLDTLKKILKMNNYFEKFSTVVEDDYYYGIATFSAFPIINKKKICFSNSKNICIYTDLLINNDTVRVYNFHLESIRFEIKDYKFIDNIKFRMDEEQAKGAKGIIGKLKQAFIKRAQQADTISGHINKSPYPVIICGDFNDTPFSYAYRKIKGQLYDSFIENGKGFGVTYSGKFPSYRIDYILYSEPLQSLSYQRGPSGLSDHIPVIFYFKM
ncbi:MAG: endonuclease/exonuclease/phosphatase family protein [Bacteroidia bacterium]|nr:endonuclease/exonuclease/phosphatase family protein [Bacteroidia bacterium]